MLPREYEPLSGIWIPDPTWAKGREYPPTALVWFGQCNLRTLHLVRLESGRLLTRYVSYSYLLLKDVILVSPHSEPDDKTLNWSWQLDDRQYLRIQFDDIWVPLVPSSLHGLTSLGFDIRETLRVVALCKMVDEPFSEVAEWLLPPTDRCRPPLA